MKPPGNGPGVLTHTPDEKQLTGHSEDKSGFSVVQDRPRTCQHRTVLVEYLPPESVHFAHEVCARCRRHVRWIAKPATIARRGLTAFRLAKLAMCSSLSACESTFIRSVSEQRKLSPKQLEIIDRIASQHLGAAP